MTKDHRHRLPWLPEAFLARASWKHARELLPRVVIGKIDVKDGGAYNAYVSFTVIHVRG